jgi:lipopolysaccharide export LptBFGC system permease protein LptF
MQQIFESLMVIFFGFSWPANIVKSYKVRTTRGKSLLFLILVLTGYFFGITSKLLSNTINYVLVFYIINSVMVLADIILYFRNRAIDRQTGS